MTLASQLLQYIITGVTIGSIYAMVAIGFNIIYNVTEAINFAQGEFVMLGGLVMVFFRVTLKLPVLFSLPLTISVVMAVGILLDRIAIRPIRKPTVLSMVIATIGASFFIRGAAMFIWGKNPFDLPPFSGRNPITFLGAAIQPQSLWVLGFLVAVVIVLTIFFDRTIMGKALRACAVNPSASSLVGINVKYMILISFALSAAIGAIGGIVITPISLMEYDRGAMLAVKGFSACAVGGIGNFPGAVLGGILIGLIESLGAGLISSGYKDVFALLALLLILFVKPSGLLGSAEVSKIRKF
ncbi:MAG: branched-chain amino acid ABC transporter permease [Deltaproteobacteria bacterium]|nr:branched-chain amino acid ABC transporter permease [Deltaproteobacteria bacterium]RLB90012.1 MAG: branched-chain amino acid ABC transporter permease [Deltaproteobacteria bacterium]RLB92222.1 MAG: branched-chain amino acid ABC transporter permease [Deltaproteobacteria bacterium]RLC12693.1 MAG: branched-chain amino acid ABC transporter permease [Deltaproteobacteria bacterium]